jgi:glutamate 5-kinase
MSADDDERKEFTHVCVIKVGSSTVIDAASGKINHEALALIAQVRLGCGKTNCFS